MRILVAEDDLVAASVLEATLKAGGHEVIVVSNGAEAWRILQSDDPPRIAFLDWMMPVLDGLEVCRNVRRTEGPYIYILLLTANTDPENVVAGIDAGADDYIKKPFNPEELRARLRSGARIVKLEEELRHQATHDSLTVLLNRTAMMQRLDSELHRAAREGGVLSVAMVDIDHFKRINDTYGHQAGDKVLREVAANMRVILRPYDLIGRYGGEEFIMVFPGCDVTKAATIAERLRAFIANTPIVFGSREISVTASIGVADTETHKDADSVISVADEALLKAKTNGRNRIEIHQSHTVSN